MLFDRINLRINSVVHHFHHHTGLVFPPVSILARASPLPCIDISARWNILVKMVPSEMTTPSPSIAAMIPVIIVSSSDTDWIASSQFLDVVCLSYHSKQHTYSMHVSRASTYIDQVNIFLVKSIHQWVSFHYRTRVLIDSIRSLLPTQFEISLLKVHRLCVFICCSMT